VGNITGGVYGPLSTNYISDDEYYMTSSQEEPTCIVEVASAQDISNVLTIIAATRTPFAVKSGGHSSNGFSATTGVLISLVRLKQVILSEDNSSVEIGTGNLWTDVYTALDGSGVNTVGGRVPGPGVGGFSLGGGFSWLSDQYGLTCDNVIAFNLILPNGTITQVDSTQTDLFFALKGGLNRFGIVSSIVLKTVPQPNLIYGGTSVYTDLVVEELIAATYAFQSQNTDPKAQVILTINGGAVPEIILLSFYDGPDRPAAFDPFNDIIPLVSLDATQSFASFVSSIPSNAQEGFRGAFHTMMTTSLTVGFLQAVYNESVFWGGVTGLADSGFFLSYDVEPFTFYGQYATDSAFPHADGPLPLNLYYAWLLEADDVFWKSAIQQSIDHLTQVAMDEGIYTPDPVYPNYALSTYSGAQLYGATNAARLRTIQAEYDPNGVMELTSGFSFS